MLTLMKGIKGESAHTALMPARLICLDIETCHADKKAIEREIACWKAPSNYKDPDKIEKKRQEDAAKTKERSALLDASPIGCISARTEKVGIVFNGLDRKDYDVNHSTVVSAGNERDMLMAFREWADASTDDKTLLVGFNIIGFDLPRLRAAYMRHMLKLPKILAPRLLDDERQPAVDVMRLFLKWFTADMHGEIFISLEEVCRRLGLPAYKDKVDGSMIPDLIEKGEIKKVLTYCAVDTMSELEAYMRMTSSASEME